MNASNELDIEHLKSWVGRSEEVREILDKTRADAFAATLDEDRVFEEGDEAPGCIHWCLTQPAIARSGLGVDGHPRRGGFLPPVPLERRMWAGGELRFVRPLRVGEMVTRRSRVEAVEMKEGRSGRLVFVTVRHAISTDSCSAIDERQDIVYRDAAAGPPPAADLVAVPEGGAIDAPDGTSLRLDATTLFRYSALTFNGHRIHYDRNYCRHVEGYPALVVHGPLQATLLLREARKRFGALPKTFSYRGVSPLFEGEDASIRIEEGEGALNLSVHKADDSATMKASAEPA